MSAEGLAGLAVTGVYLLVETSIAADDVTAKLVEVVHRHQLDDPDGDGRKVSDSGRCMLEQDLSLAKN